MNYSLGMLYAQRNNRRASQYLEKAIHLRPDYPDALNNLGVLFVREQHYAEAEEKFKTCIQRRRISTRPTSIWPALYVTLNEQRQSEVLEAFLRQQPQHKMAQQTLEMLN